MSKDERLIINSYSLNGKRNPPLYNSNNMTSILDWIKQLKQLHHWIHWFGLPWQWLITTPHLLTAPSKISHTSNSFPSNLQQILLITLPFILALTADDPQKVLMQRSEMKSLWSSMSIPVLWIAMELVEEHGSPL